MNTSALKRIGVVVAAAAALSLVAACAPATDYPPVLAQAYSNLDGVNGFQVGQDVLIARLVDTNRDGVVSVGDEVRTSQYPLDFDATSFGDFQTTWHTVTTVQSVSPIISVGDANNAQFQFGNTFTDEYSEYSASGSPRIEIKDRFFVLDPLFARDEIWVQAGAPSQPNTPVDPGLTALWSDYDSFIDVDINF